MEVVILNEAKMNSLEIAQLVKTEHRNVKVSIERLMKSGVIRCASMTNSEEINNLDSLRLSMQKLCALKRDGLPTRWG